MMADIAEGLTRHRRGLHRHRRGEHRHVRARPPARSRRHRARPLVGWHRRSERLGAGMSTEALQRNKTYFEQIVRGHARPVQAALQRGALAVRAAAGAGRWRAGRPDAGGAALPGPPATAVRRDRRRPDRRPGPVARRLGRATRRRGFHASMESVEDGDRGTGQGAGRHQGGAGRGGERGGGRVQPAGRADPGVPALVPDRGDHRRGGRSAERRRARWPPQWCGCWPGWPPQWVGWSRSWPGSRRCSPSLAARLRQGRRGSSASTRTP